MPTLPDPPQALAEVWDRVTFNDVECPGLAAVTISRSNKWDTKKAQGSHGAERTFKGADLASVKIQIRLWTADDYVAFNENILPLLEPDPGKKKPESVALGHAVAWSRSLRSITVDSVSGPDADPVGIVTYDIDATEYREPDKTLAQGKPGAGAGNGATCQQLAAQLVILDSTQVVWEIQRSEAATVHGYDPAKLVEAEAQLANIAVQKNNVYISQAAAGCNNTAYLTGQDQDAAA